MTFDETAWWGDCANSFREEQKQLVYAPRMGLFPLWNCAHPPSFDLQGRSVIDIGGGPVSLLLKCLNRGHAVVLDPSVWPDWVLHRYEDCGIEFWRQPGEELLAGHSFDEAWMYNVLQHVISPQKVIENARACARTIRIFEWIEIDPYPGHPWRLEEEELDVWLDAKGFTVELNENGAVGRAYYGVFSALS